MVTPEPGKTREAITIRPATRADLDAAAAMARSLYTDSVHLDPALLPAPGFEVEYRAQLTAIVTGTVPGAIFVAVTNSGHTAGVIEGSLLHWPFLACSRRGFISMLYIDPAYRRQGLGRRLAHTMVDWYRKQDITRIELNFLVGSAAAHRFWLAQGFTPMPQRRAALDL